MRIARIFDGAAIRAVDERSALFAEASTASGAAHGGPAHPRLVAPADPRVLLGLAHNNRPDGVGAPPQAFFKSPRTVIGPGAPIVADESLGTIQAEVELAVVIARRSRNLTVSDALGAIAGVTIGNDVTAIDQNAADGLLTQSKNGDGFTPLGPWLETDLPDLDSLESRICVDGVEVARASTAELVYPVREQLAYITRYVTLDAGDVILCGCPRVWAPIRAGQTVTAEIEGLGRLENPVVAATATS